jgi:hypothetical protein
MAPTIWMQKFDSVKTHTKTRGRHERTKGIMGTTDTTTILFRLPCREDAEIPQKFVKGIYGCDKLRALLGRINKRTRK